MSRRHDFTDLLRATASGDPSAAADMIPVVYGELRRLAQSYLAGERPDHTLQATELVHEAYLRLVDQTRARINDRGHFMALAATAMRRVLVDHARRRGSRRRGRGAATLPLDEAATVTADPLRIDYVALDRALDELAGVAPDSAKVVELRFFSGLTVDDVATCIGVSSRTVRRHWTYGRAWLHRRLNEPA